MQLVGAVPQLEAEAARRARGRAAYKVHRYFHDCLPGCKKGSLKPSDHRPLVDRHPPTCRVLYVKHLQFFRAGLVHRERTFLAANRIGKTDAAAYEVRCHLTGLYPDWWEGRRFEGPTRWWAAGDTMETTRNIPQAALLGPHDGVPHRDWRGMIDAHRILDITRKSGGVANCVDTIWVRCGDDRHKGAPVTSTLQFKSYDQGRRSFQGTELEGVWLDEEPPDPELTGDEDTQGTSEIYTECLLRTMTTDGMIIATFTPLRGLTPFLNDYLKTSETCDAKGAPMSSATLFNFDASTETEEVQ